MNADGSPFDYIRRFAPFPPAPPPPAPQLVKKREKKVSGGGGRVSGPRPPAGERKKAGGVSKRRRWQITNHVKLRVFATLPNEGWLGTFLSQKGEGILGGRLKADVTILCGGNRGESSELMRRLKVIKAALAIERREGGPGEESRDVTLAGGGGRKSECTA